MTPSNNQPTELEFQITDTKLYVLVVPFQKLLEELKSGFKRTVKWNKCRSQMTIQNSNSNLSSNIY